MVTSNVIGRLKSFPVWFARCRHCRGFGVQSPWAYAFIRYVIGEKWPYYAYESLDVLSKDLSCSDKKLYRLFFRISNYVRSGIVLDFSSGDELLSDYVTSGCGNSRVVRVMTGMHVDEYSRFLDNVGKTDFVIISLEGNWRDFFIEARKRAGDKTLFVVRGINDNGAARRCWRDIVDDVGNIVTFDLYHCGIVFFDKKRYKQNYIVNF